MKRVLHVARRGAMLLAVLAASALICPASMAADKSSIAVLAFGSKAGNPWWDKGGAQIAEDAPVNRLVDQPIAGAVSR